MSESKAAESYQAFESLINRFGGTTRTPERDSHAHQWREKPKRNVFASAAPPLVPLMEEGDQLQEELFSYRWNPSQPNALPVKGKWKHSTIKSNHLNAPDFDALETDSVAESVASCSDSAYSSKSESLSPVTGSFTELSDRVSHDSKPRHHVKNSDASTVYIKQTGRLAALKATFEAGGDGGHSSPCEHDTAHDSDADSVSSEVVPRRTKAWNQTIGEWVFEGIKALDVPSPKVSPRFRRPSNEVRVPTPISTPLYGSMENLADSGSRTSLFSSSGVWDEGEDNTSWDQDTKHPLGKFVPPEARRSSIATISLKKSDSPPLNTKGQTTSAEKANGSVESRPFHSHSTAWIEAKKKHDMLKMKKEYRQSSEEEPQREKKLSASTIEQRARLFGETRPRRGLRRTQSLLVHSQSSPRTAREPSARDASNAFV